MIKANNTKLKSWIEIPENSDFPIQNIPFGIVSFKNAEPRPATRIGDYAIDLSALSDYGYFDDLPIEDFSPFYQPILNDFIEMPLKLRRTIRDKISDLFNHDCPDIRDNEDQKKLIIIPIQECKTHLPVFIPNYTDFYSSREHATNVGKMFRDPENALLPNWLHIPVGYHGRSSSIVVSGAQIHRPKGQILEKNKSTPILAPCKLLDFELEMAFITSSNTKLGEPIPLEKTHNKIFGLVLFNDLSARDIQKWEYQPLGPFLSKSFGSVISPWIVTLDALENFRISQPKPEKKLLPYLKFKEKNNYDITLEVYLKAKGKKKTKISTSNSKYLYWSIHQQLAHQTINGCNISVGDIYASGTISGPTPNSYGSMLELSWMGTKKINIGNGETRTFIKDNDEIILRAYAKNSNVRIGFGESRVKILAAKES
ncbi:MAG: fumarylacetoacetase [Bacteroidales bacterium]